MKSAVSAGSGGYTRQQEIVAFLDKSGFGHARRDPIPGDASFRRYERIHMDGKSWILMDAPPEKEDVKPFLEVAEHLVEQGFSAPRILVRDEALGFLLLEDLGDDLFTRLLDPADGQEEWPLYQAAVDVLIALHRQPSLASAPKYDEQRLMDEALLLTDWFLPQVKGVEDREARQEYIALWKQLLPLAMKGQSALVLRDYHAGNLLWLPNREGIKKVGLLDFQDAVNGPIAYDLVSLLEDARRDVSARTVKLSIEHYLRMLPHGVSHEEFITSYAVLGAQRNCKIVGIFCRLGLRDGKFGYVKFLPRVWGHLLRDLEHPALLGLRDWMNTHVPERFRGEVDLQKGKR